MGLFSAGRKPFGYLKKRWACFNSSTDTCGRCDLSHKAKTFNMIGITFQTSSVASFPPCWATVCGSMVGMWREQKTYVFTVVAGDGGRWLVRAVNAGHGDWETTGGHVAGMKAWGATQSLKEATIRWKVFTVSLWEHYWRWTQPPRLPSGLWALREA